MARVTPIEYLYLPDKERKKLPFDPTWVYDWFSDILGKSPRTPELHVILSRLMWAYSRLNTIDTSQDYDEEDAMLLIMSFILLYDALNILQGPSVTERKILSEKRAPYFGETINNNFSRNSIKSRTDKEFVRFLRTISFAHTMGADAFFKEGYRMMSISVDGVSTSPTMEQVYHSSYIYIHVIYKTPKTTRPKILNINKNELRRCIMAFSSYGEKLYEEWRKQR